MKIVFEETKDFERLPEIYQTLARVYLLGKRFDSAEEALDQSTGRWTLGQGGFYLAGRNPESGILPYFVPHRNVGVMIHSNERILDVNALRTILIPDPIEISLN